MTALGKLVWDHIEPGFETAIRNTYVDAVGMDPSQVPDDLISREYRKLQLLLTEDLGSEFRGLLTRIVQDNIAAGLNYASYLIGYGIYSGYLMTALNETMPADDPQAEQKRRFLLGQTHQEASMAIGTFIADLEEKASRRRDALVESCERTVVSRISALGTAMGAVDEIAHFVLDKAEGSGARAQDAMASVETVTSQSETVAAATQELSSAARDLAVQVQTASTSSSVVTTESEKAEDTVRALVMEASRIDEVVQLIRSIAEQTRMLALNATIEAARAGAAGRGFSVVAGEVKELARRTSEATDRIADQVQAIQKSADGAHDSFRSVRTEMARLNEVTASIASLGEEQSATTNEIARSTSESAESVRVLKERVDSLAGFGKMTLEYSQKVSQRVDEARQAQSDLKSSIFAFLSEVRSDGTEAGSLPAKDRPSARFA